MQGKPDHFGRIHYAGYHQIFIDVRLGIVAKRLLAVSDFIDDDRTFSTGIFGNLTKRLHHGAHDDFHPQLVLIDVDPFSLAEVCNR